MRFIIQHHTHYRYSRSIRLGPQLLRFAPGVPSIIKSKLHLFPQAHMNTRTCRLIKRDKSGLIAQLTT